MSKFCILRAYLKSTFLKKKNFFKSMILKKIFFLKSMILNEIVFVKSIILNYKFFVLSNFESNFFQRVRFRIEIFTTRQILNNLPESTTCTFHIAFLPITMYNYNAQYLRQLDNSILHRSNKSFSTLYCKDFTFDFAMVSRF